MSTCLCVQCSNKSPSSAEIFFSFIMIAFVYSLSMAFSSSYGGNGDQLQQSVIALLVVVYIYPYLVTCAALGQSCAAVFLFIAVIRTQWQRRCPSGVPCLLLVLTDPAAKKQREEGNSKVFKLSEGKSCFLW